MAGSFELEHGMADDALRIGVAADGLGAERLLRKTEQLVHAAHLQERRHGAEALRHVRRGRLVRRDVPGVPEGVLHAGFAIAVELIGRCEESCAPPPRRRAGTWRRRRGRRSGAPPGSRGTASRGTRPS